MFANIIKSSSPLVNSRQLFRLNITASSLISVEHGPPLEPREQPQPLRRNFFTFSIISFGVSSFYHIKICHGLFVTFVKYARAKSFVVMTRALLYEGGPIVKKQFMSDPQNERALFETCEGNRGGR